MLGVRVLPFEGASILGLGADIAHQLARKIAHGDEDAAGDHIAFDACEPYLDPVKPGRVSRGEMEPYAGVLLQQGCDLFGFVGGKIIEDDMDLLAGFRT